MFIICIQYCVIFGFTPIVKQIFLCWLNLAIFYVTFDLDISKFHLLCLRKIYLNNKNAYHKTYRIYRILKQIRGWALFRNHSAIFFFKIIFWKKLHKINFFLERSWKKIYFWEVGYVEICIYFEITISWNSTNRTISHFIEVHTADLYS